MVTAQAMASAGTITNGPNNTPVDTAVHSANTAVITVWARELRPVRLLCQTESITPVADTKNGTDSHQFLIPMNIESGNSADPNAGDNARI